jgi:hypothetical protein
VLHKRRRRGDTGGDQRTSPMLAYPGCSGSAAGARGGWLPRSCAVQREPKLKKLNMLTCLLRAPHRPAGQRSASPRALARPQCIAVPLSRTHLGGGLVAIVVASCINSGVSVLNTNNSGVSSVHTRQTNRSFARTQLNAARRVGVGAGRHRCRDDAPGRNHERGRPGG